MPLCARLPEDTRRGLTVARVCAWPTTKGPLRVSVDARDGAELFLLVAAWCTLTESVVLTATVLRTLLAFAHRRWSHARDAVRSVRDEIRSWKA